MLYLRHGPKAYANGKSSDYPLDPELTEAGKNLAYQKFHLLLQHYQPPNKIITSPYCRARQTASIAQSVILQLFSVYVPIIDDPVIGEYLGNSHQLNLENSVRPETFNKGPLLVEYNPRQFLARIKYHYDSIEFTDKDNFWFISHGLFIQNLAKHHGINLLYPSELSGFYVDAEKSVII